MTNKLRQNKIWINLPIFLAVLAALIFFLIMPSIKSVKNRADEIQRLKVDQEINQKKIADFEKLENQHKIFNNPENNLNRIISVDQEVDFIKKMENLAEITNNKLDKKIDETKAAAKKDSKSKDGIRANLPYDSYITVQASLEGDYPSLMNFINKLENLDNFVNVTAINLGKDYTEEPAAGPFNDAGGSPDQTPKKTEILKSFLEVVVYVKK